MLTNGFLKSKETIKLIQKAIIAGIGATSSKEAIKKAASELYSDIQNVVNKLLCKLEEAGEIRTRETRVILKELQKKSEAEKARIYRKIQKNSKYLFNSAKDMIITPIALANQLVKAIKKSNTALGNKSKKKRTKR